MASINTVARAGMSRPYSSPTPAQTIILHVKNFLLTLLAALVVMICQAVPEMFDLAATVRHVGAGNLGAGGADAIWALTARLFGWGAAGAARAVFQAWPWFIFILILFFVARRVTPAWRRAAVSAAWAIALAASVQGLWSGWAAWPARVDDLRLVAPVGLIESAGSQTQRVFINPSARIAVAALKPDLVEREPAGEPPAALLRSPARWRAEDRQRPFSAVLLTGRLAEAKPLIQHLSDSPDWFLASVDNQGLLFLRGDARPQPEIRVPEFESPRDRAIFLAQAALALDAAGLKTRASRAADEALALAPDDSEVLVLAASLAASQNRWESAKKMALKSLAARPSGFEATCLLAWAELETRSAENAFEITTRLARKYPDDQAVLLLHARAARSSKNLVAETDALERLLRLSKNDPESRTRIHIYLGQVWAQRGFPDQAMENYRQALAGSLSPAESREVSDAMEIIQAKRLPTGG